MKNDKFDYIEMKLNIRINFAAGNYSNFKQIVTFLLQKFIIKA